MSRFNEKSGGCTRTANHEGAPAYSLDAFTELYSLVVTSTLSNKFYEKADATLTRLRALVKKVGDPALIGKLAVYAREKMYLRTLPVVLAVELARSYQGAIVGNTVTRVIQRVDEITEMLAYYQHANGRKGTKRLNKLSKQLQRGVAAAFSKFDEYQFAKYDRSTDVKLKDALFLTHPKAESKEKQAIFDRIVSGTLKTPYTWEVQLSEKGNNTKTWEGLLDSKKLGYMALLRNLRNILNAGVSAEHIKRLCKHLSNPNAVRRAKQLPFRFYSAFKELDSVDSPYTATVLNALEDAVLTTAENIQGFDYDTTVVVACDVSASMQTHINKRSTVQYYDIGLILGMLLQNRCKSVISGMFGDTWKVVQLPRKAILSNVIELHRREGEVGYSTNGWKVLAYLIGKQIAVDKIMLFTDCQLWNSRYENPGAFKHLWSVYKKSYPGARLYLFDLSRYGTTPVSVHDNSVTFIAGWSDKVFDMLAALENRGTIIDEIKRIEL